MQLYSIIRLLLHGLEPCYTSSSDERKIVAKTNNYIDAFKEGAIWPVTISTILSAMHPLSAGTWTQKNQITIFRESNRHCPPIWNPIFWPILYTSSVSESHRFCLDLYPYGNCGENWHGLVEGVTKLLVFRYTDLKLSRCIRGCW